MIGPVELVEHFAALAVIGVAACGAGYPIAKLLPAPLRREGWAAWPMLGAAYWAAALYLFPFRGGLLVGAGIAFVLAVVAALVDLRSDKRPFRRRRVVVGPKRGRFRLRAGIILLIGCALFVSPLVNHHVPMGMDASRYATNARVLAGNAGLAYSHAPFAPEVRLGASNHGLPALAAVPVLCGLSPVSAVLALLPFTFSCLVLGVYLVLRAVARRRVAAVLALVCAWYADGMGTTISWGGFPTVAAIAVGLLGARLTVDVWRRCDWLAAIPLGLCIGAMPLIHGVGAAGWIYIALPAAAVVGFVVSRRRWRGGGAVSASALPAALILGAYLVAGRPAMDQSVVQWIRQWQGQHRPAGSGWAMLSAIPGYVMRGNDTWLTVVALLGLLVLLARRRFLAAAFLAGTTVLLFATVANSRYWILPGSAILYPERAAYWASPLSVLGLALAWRALPGAARSHRLIGVLVALIVLGAGVRHRRHYQHYAGRPVLSNSAWQGLQWARQNLDPKETMVLTPYDTAGSYLPAVAGVACMGWHLHVDQLADRDSMMAGRAVTHALYIDPEAVARRGVRKRHRSDYASILQRIREGPAEVVYDGGAVKIYRLSAPAEVRAPQ